MIVAGSLLALLVWTNVTDKTGSQYLKSSVHENAEGAGAHAEYQVDTAKLAFKNKVSENEENKRKTKYRGWYEMVITFLIVIH